VGSQPQVDRFENVVVQTLRSPRAADHPDFGQQQDEVRSTLQEAVDGLNAALRNTGVTARIEPWIGEPQSEAHQVVLERISDGFEANAFRVKWESVTGYPVHVRPAGQERDLAAEDHPQLIEHLESALQRAALVAQQMAGV